MSAFEKCSTVRLFKRTDLLLIYYILLVTIFPIAILFIYLFIYVFIFMTSSKLFLVCLYFFPRTAAGRSDTGAERRLQDIVARRKLVDLAKAQAQEVAVLRAEVERLRMRTFPALVQIEH